MIKHRWLVVSAGGILIAALGTAILWRTSWQSAEIPDASQPTSLSLEAPRSSVTGISVRVTGQIDGEAEIWAGNWSRQRVGGSVDWQVYHDWFKPNCLLNYQPLGHASGKLLIQYQFH